MNKVVLMGRLTKDPVRGNGVVKYTLAVDRRGKGTDFIPCVCFDRSADFAETYLRKGTKICIDGRVQTGKYTDKDGKTVYTTDIIVNDQEFCEKKQTEENPFT